MASTNKTSNIGLNQWLGTDYRKTEDDNSDNLAIDNKFGDIDALISNNNLLINGDFQVWQRGESIVATTTKYIADRWTIVSTDGTYAVTASKNSTGGGLKTIQSTASYYLKYSMEDADFAKISGKTVTLSYYLNGVLVKSTFTATTGTNIVYIGVPSATINTNIITNVKLELGSIATPFVSNPYVNELAMCKRYYQVLDINTQLRAIAYNGSTMYFWLPLQATLRILPTLIQGAESTDWKVSTMSATAQTGFALSISSTCYKGGILILATKASHGLTDAVLNIVLSTNSLDSEIY